MKSFTLLPSVDRLLSGATAAVKRFPLALLCATIGAIIAVVLVEHQGSDKPHELVNLLAVSALGLPLFIALTLIGEKRNWSIRARVIVQGVGVVALVLYYFSLPPDLFAPHYHAIRFLLLILGLHFLVAVAPYIGGAPEQGFWQYNKSLLLGLLTAAFYSAALYVGFAVALAAADYLFGFDVKGDTYGELWMLMAGIVNTWIFLALIPPDLKALETTEDYPNGLKVFSQYVLLPLVGLYFVILIAYEAKIIVEWNWPKGWVSQLVLWYSVVGILSLLLLHPLKKRADSKWIGRFGDWFFRLLIPLVIMLFLAIRRRIADYGVTEPRYIVLGLAIGLSVVVIYFLISKRKDIRVIPIVLVILAMVAAYGPLSASSVSTWSQTSRLEEMLVKHGLLKDGALQKPETKIPLEARRNMSSVIAYLNESRGPEAFAKWLPDSIVTHLSAQFDSGSERASISETIASHLGFGFNWSRYYTLEGRYVSLWVKEPRTLDVAGFDRMLTFHYPPDEPADSAGNYQLTDYSCTARLLPSSSIFQVAFKLQGDGDATEINVDLAARVEELYMMDNTHQIEQDSLTFDRTAGVFGLRLFVQNLGGQKHDSTLELSNLRAKILVRRQQ
jgi:hypothetical protein